ncbi:MAG: HAMP domain-containing histidine kinase [Pseudomonadota bacterium]|nr:HAMP domain-containing histidine kinase [Pseudomonadota bacterium]
MDQADGATRPRLGLSAKLLLLTVLFVMVSEVLIFVPSIANFRLNWLSDRIAAARIAALTLEAAPDRMVPDSLRRELLMDVGAKSIVVSRGGVRRALAAEDRPPPVHASYDLRERSVPGAILDALEALWAPAGRCLRVTGEAAMGADAVEIVIDETPLKAAMLTFSRNILLLSLVISALTACLVYLSLNRLLVRPMRRLTAAMVAFSRNPEAPDTLIVPSDRRDELGVAERQLAAMQGEIRDMLRQKSHLAALGLAVSKINHDLRNMLASAQLMTDRIGAIKDPTVQRLVPKLLATLDRAVSFCESTLKYGSASEPPPRRERIRLARLADEVAEAAGLRDAPRLRWVNGVDPALQVDADPDQLFRVLVNLVRNSVQAIESAGEGARGEVRVTGRRDGAVMTIEVSDTGPGLPEKAKARLFQAFQGSTRSGGAGLGLAIAAELVRAHGGDIRLVEGTLGATFQIVIPDRIARLEERRRQRA